MELVESDASTFYYQFPENGIFFWKNNRVSNFNCLSTDCGYKNYLNGGFVKVYGGYCNAIDFFPVMKSNLSPHNILRYSATCVLCRHQHLNIEWRSYSWRQYATVHHADCGLDIRLTISNMLNLNKHSLHHGKTRCQHR